MFKLKVVENYEEVSKEAFDVLKEVVVSNEYPVLGLATGSSPIGLYKNIIEDYKNGASYKHVSTVNLDEYIGIDQKHEQSYYTFMHENLFNHIDINSGNINLPCGNVADIDVECKRYEAILNARDIDLQVLGIGSNGHIGFNEPGTPFDSVTHIVDLKEETRKDNARFFDSIDDVPTQAISMGIASIMRAKKIVLIASGANKADAVAAMINGKYTTDCPASALQQHPDVVVIVDKAAGSKLNVGN